MKVDLGGATTPLPHSWKRIFGSGHAALGLRKDYQAQLKQAKEQVHIRIPEAAAAAAVDSLSRSLLLTKEQLGLVGVRAHGTFDDDMGPIVKAHRTYNFTLLKKLWTSQVR